MTMDANEIESLIRAGIPDAEVRLEDLRGDGDHYAAYVSKRTALPPDLFSLSDFLGPSHFRSQNERSRPEGRPFSPVDAGRRLRRLRR